jgi:3alpha(or 20beta)-hydroxysteroid dehydrogenase
VSARLEGTVALITGAARGQGEAEARLFAAEGASVVLGDVLDGEGRAVAKDIGDAAVYTHLDVTDEEQWQAAVELAEDRFGPIGVLVNNAGILGFDAIDKMDVDTFRKVLDVNAVGTFLGMKSVVSSLVRNGGGAIVNISSTAGLMGQAYLSAYVASKWAVRGMTKSAAAELGRKGIRVNSVHPGGIDTEMIAGTDTSAPYYRRLPISRVGSVDEVARVVLFLASDESSYMTGAELAVDGGATCADHGIYDR